MTQNRENGSGPKKDANTPGVVDVEASSTLASPSMAAIKPPFELSTARITATIPKSITIPWIKSFMAVAM